MATTMAQAFAEQIRRQVKIGETVLNLAGMGTENDRTDAAIGPPENVLTVRGNISDVAHMNHLFYLCILQVEGVGAVAPRHLERALPASLADFMQYIGPRETHSAEEALEMLRNVNDELAKAIEGLTDEQLNREAPSLFPGHHPLVRDLLFIVLNHGALHLGQAWGILKSAGITDVGFEVLIS